MQVLQAVITGTIQGLSEFLPISSSAHIVFSNYLYSLLAGIELSSINQQEEIFFDIVAHLGTLFAVCIYFYKDLKNILINSFNALRLKDYKNTELKISGYIVLSTLITGIMGLILKNPVKNLIATPEIVCLLLFITGLILLASEKFYKGDKEINLKNVIFISIAQGLAIFPGFSRSGLTISTALFNGIDRLKAARFSFLMSIPVILLASMIYPLMEINLNEIVNFNFVAIFIGFITSFVVGYLCIKYFMQLLAKISLKGFAYYCFVASCAMFILFQFCHR